ncbi:unnamed protein product [Adineta steineri]|uniref:Carrier domain-containing protein n=2 Tax=Adineta steineri TaxID=433720 RepID=A0A815UXC8_9BILA|nr:unnamed protein product [Adineta steineri]
MICSAITVLLTTYKQVSIIFAWQLDQVALNENNDDLAFKQNEELICGTLSHILQTIQKSSPYFYPFVYVLTDHAQFNNDSNLNLIASPFIGLARSLITEYERNRLKLIDLQISLNNNNQSTFIHTLIEYMINSRYSTDICQVVLRRNHTNQNQKSKYEQSSIIPKRDADEKAFRLCVPQSHFLSELTWIEEEREKELLPGIVEVCVHCVGINFRDVLKSRGLYPYTQPGSDFVGTIVRACPTTNYQVGDHVVGNTSLGTYHSHIMINSQLIIRIPSDFPLTDEQLCGMPTPLLTVIYSLKYCVHLKTDQTVLIHASTGAAGQWCIQYCQYIGARVIATAGTEEKRRFLHEYYGIEHVFNSRDTSFVNNIRKILPQGVDVIVNSLSGNLLKESIKLLAYHGNFVEWGKRDIYHNGNLSMFQLRSDCSFHVTDFAGLADHVSPLIRVMLEEAIDLFIQHKLRAVEPTVTYEPSQVIEALLRCNSGQVMGKTVIRITLSDQPLTIHKKQSNSLLKVVSDNTMFPSEVCNQGTILISGGLGLTMSRAVVAEDRTLNNLIQEHLSLVLPPKVRGAWYLHQATQFLDAPIHFFIMFSSIRNHLLEGSSAGYNAGNQFLDALAHYRMTQLSLPALSVSLPAVSSASMFHRQRDRLSTLQSTHGFEVLPPIAVFELIERFHTSQKTCPCPVIFAVNWQTLYERRHKLPIFQLNKIVEARYTVMKLTNVSTASTGLNSTTTLNLNRKATIIERIQMAVARLLGAADIVRILVDRSLTVQGMDSLAALSLYNWLGQETTVFMPLVDLLQGNSIETIATVIHNKLNE